MGGILSFIAFVLSGAVLPVREDVNFVSAMWLTSQGWNCPAWFAAWNGASELNFQYLYHTPGDERFCLMASVLDPRTKRINVTLTNYPGLKNGRLQPYEALYGYTSKRFCRGLATWDRETIVRLQLNARDALLDLLPMLRSDQELWVTPDLESGCTAREQGQYIRAIRPIMETAPVPVRFVSYGSLAPGADYFESRHSSNPSCGGNLRCIKSNDGSTITRWKGFFSGVFKRIAWVPGSNCNKHGRAWIPPKERTACFDYEDAAALRPYLAKDFSLSCWVLGVCGGR